MPSSQIERKLAAIMFTDIAGYTALSAKDENKALELLDKQKQILTPIIEEFNGTLHKEMGDGLLFTFPTVTEAVKCGIKIQEETKANADLNLRIGIHEGEITLKDGDALGDDVNVASRIEAFATSGGIAISSKVQQNISSLPEFETSYVGKPELKGVAQEVKVYCITSHGLPKADEIVEPIMVESKSNFNIFALTGGILTVIGVAFWIAIGIFDVSFGGKTEVPSVGILMMENLGNEDEEFWSSGMTADLITKVAGAGFIRVAPLKDVRNIDSNLSIEEIAKKLRVKYILTHSFLIKDDGFDLWCTLENIENGVALFSNKISEPMNMTTQMVGKLANDIITSLKVETKQNIMKAATANADAYEYYLKAKYKYQMHENKEDYEIVKGLINKAIELDDNLIVAKIMLGYLYADRYEDDKAMESYTIALKQAEVIGDNHGIAISLNAIGLMYYYQDKLDKAMEYLNRSLYINKEYNNKVGIQNNLNNIGLIYDNKGEYLRAVSSYLGSIKINQEINDDYGVMITLSNIAELYLDRGEFDEALDYNIQALDIAENFGNKHILVDKLISVGNNYLNKGEYTLALDYYNRAGKVDVFFNEFNDESDVVPNNIGIVYYLKQDYQSAIQFLEESMSIQLKRQENIGQEIDMETTTVLFLSYKNLGKEYDVKTIYQIIKETEFIGYAHNYYLYLLLEDKTYLETAYNQVQEKAENLEPDVAAKFLSYPIPAAIVEEWEKVK